MTFRARSSQATVRLAGGSDAAGLSFGRAADGLTSTDAPRRPVVVLPGAGRRPLSIRVHGRTFAPGSHAVVTKGGEAFS